MGPGSSLWGPLRIPNTPHHRNRQRPALLYMPAWLYRFPIHIQDLIRAVGTLATYLQNTIASPNDAIRDATLRHLQEYTEKHAGREAQLFSSVS